VLLVTEDPDDPEIYGGAPIAVTVVQPNEDGSYWRKIVRNKMVRMKEKRRIQTANAFAKEALAKVLSGEAATPEEGAEAPQPFVVSSWGPYTSISGTAKVRQRGEIHEHFLCHFFVEGSCRSRTSHDSSLCVFHFAIAEHGRQGPD